MNFGQWFGFIVLIVLSYVLWQMRQLLLLLLMAIVLAIALNLLVRRFQRWWRISRSGAVLLAAGVLFLTLGLTVWLIIPPFVDQFQQLVTLVPQGISQFIQWLEQQRNQLDPDIINGLPNFQAQDLQELAKQLQPIINELLGGGWNIFYGSLGHILSLLLLLALSFMLLAEPHAYRQGLIRTFPAFYRHRVDEILILCQQELQEWLKGVGVNMAIVAVFSWIGLLILQIPLALSQAILAGLFTFIPNLGLALSVIPPMAIALIDAPWKIWAILILYIGIQQIEANYLTPRIQTVKISLTPAITLLAQIFFTISFGFLGLVLAIPLTIITQTWLRETLVKDILNHWEIRKS